MACIMDISKIEERINQIVYFLLGAFLSIVYFTPAVILVVGWVKLTHALTALDGLWFLLLIPALVITVIGLVAWMRVFLWMLKEEEHG